MKGTNRNARFYCLRLLLSLDRFPFIAYPSASLV